LKGGFLDFLWLPFGELEPPKMIHFLPPVLVPYIALKSEELKKAGCRRVLFDHTMARIFRKGSEGGSQMGCFRPNFCDRTVTKVVKSCQMAYEQ
tara:strand:- start:13275 stop:13556 length:282 start_codon:yes stop_codon:yes gene_type:complete